MQNNKERYAEHHKKYNECHKDKIKELSKNYQYKRYTEDEKFRREKKTKMRESYHIPERRHKIIEQSKAWIQQKKKKFCIQV
jgi:hypothetical protein